MGGEGGGSLKVGVDGSAVGRERQLRLRSPKMLASGTQCIAELPW